jgi:enediyne biosynthesis protein E5
MAVHRSRRHRVVTRADQVELLEEAGLVPLEEWVSSLRIGVPGSGTSRGPPCLRGMTIKPAPSPTDGRRADATPGRQRDPRTYQIATLGGLLAYGLLWLGFDVPLSHVVTILATAVLVQAAATRLSGRPGFDPRSALISGLSLCLLLRTDSCALAAVTAAIAISSKFLLRIEDKHVFNPTNFALVVMMLLTGQVWVSPGQWGNTAVFGFLLASAGGLVVNRAARSDVTLAFLISYAALLAGRSLFLGEPMSIPLHRLESGALVLFAFFMISDPKTTPNSRSGRILFATLVAAGAWVVQFKLFRTNGLLWSLVFFSLAVPLIDRLFPGPRFHWGRPAGFPVNPNGDPHEADDLHRRLAADRPVLGPSRARLLRVLRGQSG